MIRLRPITTVCLVPIFVLVSCVSSPEAKSARFIEAGKKYLKNKDASRAILQFQNAVKVMPRNADAYYQLAVAYLSSADLKNGIICLRKALELNPKHADARLRLAQLKADTDDPTILKDAQEQLQAYLQESPDNSDALQALALTEIKLGEQNDAMQLLERALAVAPQDLIVAVTMAQAKVQQRDFRGAEEVLQKASQNSPKSVEAVIVLGKFYGAQNRAPEAEQQFRKALQMDPQNAVALASLAVVLKTTGRKPEAEQCYKRLSTMSDKAYKAAYGLYLSQEGRYDEATREFERLFKEDPSSRTSRTRLVQAYQMANRTSEAQTILTNALKKNPRDLDALLQRGEISLAAKKYEQAEADLDQVLHLRPEDPEVHYVLGKLQQARGSELTYRQELAKALQLNPYLMAVRLELSQDLISNKEPAAAVAIMNESPAAQKEVTPAIVQRNWALWAAGDMPEMRKGIDSGLSRERTTDLLLQDGIWKLRSGNFSSARAALEEALKINPQDLRALDALKRSYEAQKQAPMALQKVKEFAAQQPNSAPVQQFLGVMLLAHGERQEARTAFMAAKSASPQYVSADLSLIQMDAAEGKLDDARNRLMKFLSDNPGYTLARLWLGNLEEMKGNHDAAIMQFRKVADADPSNAQNLNNFAYLLAEYGNQPGEALKYAEKAVALSPDRPEYCDTLGWILYRKGLYSPAVQYLERAVSKDHGDVVWKYHLAMAYAKGGSVARGKSLLDTALKINPKVPEAKVAQEVIASSR